MKSKKSAMSMFRAAWNNTNFEYYTHYDEERDESYRWMRGKTSMRTCATRQLRKGERK